MNRNELRAEIARQGFSVGEFCKRAGIAPSTYHRKMQDPSKVENVPQFTQGEISNMRIVLGLNDEQLSAIFFSGDVS